MNENTYSVLTINGGSSSIKFSLYQCGTQMRQYLSGKIERIGLPDTTLTFNDTLGDQQGTLAVDAADVDSVINFLLDWLAQTIDITQIKGVGHRVVHGMNHTQPELVSKELLEELHRISTYDPEHLPLEIKLIEIFRQRYPNLPQVACFDTAFHAGMPRVAKLLPIPRRFDAMGIQRYGFHGLSYSYLMQALANTAGTNAAQGKVILAHLGNGASLAAVHNGQSIDTSMGFTPTGGLPMGTRTGDLDPGTAWFLMQNENLTPQQFNHLINHESGLLGVSESSADMRDLLALAATDVRAAEAVELFCYQTRKWIGSYAAALGGLDTLVFSGGIGENAAVIRQRICSGLAFLGIVLDAARNAHNEDIVSADTSRVMIRVIKTNEELEIAKAVCQLLALRTGKK